MGAFQEAAHAAGRYGHIMFPESIHQPAAALTERALDSACAHCSLVHASVPGRGS